MKIAGAVLVILALVIGFVPQFADCHAQGRVMTMMDGSSVEMQCFWSAMAAIVIAIPLAALGGLLALSRRKETRRTLTALGTVLGAAVILIPSTLIGVCADPKMLCNLALKPTLLLSGSLVILTSLIALIVAQTQPEESLRSVLPQRA